MNPTMDTENQVCVAQAFTGSATVSAHSIQKQSAAQDLSIGRKIGCIVYFRAAGAGTTHTLKAIQADVTALTTNKEVLASRTIATSDVELGKPYVVEFPEGSIDRLHLGFEHEATGGTTTATLDVYIGPVDEIPFYKSFPKINVAQV